MRNNSEGKIKILIHDDLHIDDPSRSFILRYWGLSGSIFINSDLEFQSPYEFINDNIIDFWIKYLIKISPFPDKFCYVEAPLLNFYYINTISNIKECSASMKNKIFGFSQ